MYSSSLFIKESYHLDLYKRPTGINCTANHAHFEDILLGSKVSFKPITSLLIARVSEPARIRILYVQHYM